MSRKDFLLKIVEELSSLKETVSPRPTIVLARVKGYQIAYLPEK